MNRSAKIGVGMTSIIMIVVSFCLTFFAVQGVIIANQNKIVCDKRSEYIKEYYEADSKATKVYAGIIEEINNPFTDNVSLINSIQGIDEDIIVKKETDGLLIEYNVEVNDLTDLFIQIKYNEKENNYSINNWETVSHGTQTYNDKLDLWNGSFEYID